MLNPQIAQMLMQLAQRRSLRPGAGVGAPNLPSIIPKPPGPGQIPTTLSPLSAAPQQGGGFRDKLGTFLGGLGPALLAQSDRGGSVWGDLGRALPYGSQAVQDKRMNEQADALIDQMNLPENMKTALRMLSAAQKLQAVMQQMQPPEVEYKELANGQWGVFSGGQLVRQVGPEDVPDSVKEAQYAAGLADDQVASFDKYAVGYPPQPAAVVNVGQPQDAITAGLGQEAASVITEGAPMARDAVAMIEQLDMAHRITQDEDFRRVTGPLSSAKDLLQRFSGDPRARTLAASYDVLVGDVVLQKLDNFKGSISDKEREYVAKISAGNRDLTVEELESGASLLMKMYKQDAVGWANEIIDIAEISAPSPYMNRHVRAARDILAKYEGEDYDPLGILR